jgi:hypothetical protein
MLCPELSAEEKLNIIKNLLLSDLHEREIVLCLVRLLYTKLP